MIDAFRNCFLCRVVLALCRRLPTWYQASILGRISNFFARHYNTSRVKRIWQGFVNRESRIYCSWYVSLLRFLDRVCLRVGYKVLPIIRESGVYKTLQKVFRKMKCLWTRCVSHGVLGRAISALDLSVNRIMIIIVGLYLPVDWLLRDILKLATVASIWDEGFFAVCIAYIIACRLKEKRDETRFSSHATPLDIPILLFCAVGFMLMCVNSPVFSIAVAGYRATVEYMLWFFVVIRLIRSDKDCVLLAKVVCLTGCAVALHGIYQYVIGAPIPAHWVSQTEAGVRSRAYSIMGSPNILGAYMVMTAPIAASFAYSVNRLWKKLLAWSVVGILCVCVLVTFSRGAWVGMCVAVVVFAVIQDRRLFALLLMAVPVAMFIPSIANRITYLFTDDFATASAVGGRALRWAVGKEMMATNPFIGFGLGRFGGAVAMQNQILEVTEEFSYFYMDNYYLKLGAEMGYTGLVAFLILVVAFIWLGLRCCARSKDVPLPVTSGIYAGLCGILAHCYFENIFEEPYMMALFWSLAAVLMYVGYVRPKDGTNIHAKGVHHV